MSSPQSSIRQGEDAPETTEIAESSSNEKTYDSAEELAQLPTGPPFDLNNFPFTFEHARDASHSINIEPDVRAPML